MLLIMSNTEYTSRINRVIDHIEVHITDKLTLDELARVACFSPYHFHRLFAALVGETLSRYIQRQRVEKAASMLLYSPEKSVTAVALDCGFSSSATFARAFRTAFEMSASDWRDGGSAAWRKEGKTDSKIGQMLGNVCKDVAVTASYAGSRQHPITWRIEMKTETNLTADVTIEQTEDQHVAYVRHVGPYAGDVSLFGELFGKLCTWAGPRGLLGRPDVQMLTLYHDDPEITDEEKLRISVCVTVPEDTEVDGEIGKMAMAGGATAVARFELDADQYAQAWGAVYGGWLPSSGYQPDDRPAYERCLNNPDEHPDKKHLVEICVPVRPL